MTPDDLEELFAVSHLRPELAQVSAHWRDLALYIFAELPPSAERTLAVRSLWESKNLAIYAKTKAMNAAEKGIEL